MSPTALIFVLCLVIGGLWAVMAYNRLVTLRNRIANAFAQIDVQLKRRHDLIPNLVEVARGYMAHESSTLEAVARARGQAAQAAAHARRHPGQAAAMASLATQDSLAKLLMASLAPVVIICKADSTPSTRGRRCVPPAPGTMPMLTSGSAICVPWATTR